jgi:hypothetical protein
MGAHSSNEVRGSFELLPQRRAEILKLLRGAKQKVGMEPGLLVFAHSVRMNPVTPAHSRRNRWQFYRSQRVHFLIERATEILELLLKKYNIDLSSRNPYFLTYADSNADKER